MKILFAVSNDNITTSVVNKYQQKYKEIITSKNVYYFNAIIKELQKNKSYDTIVIGEDLEPISNNDYDAIDKFLFEKLDGISDEASKPTGEDIPIIFICSDRRTTSDQLLIKLFGIGIYNAIIGNDRSIDTVCNLINKPRNKKEAKHYYKIESEDVEMYENSNDQDVSETEIQNILSHYKKIGSNVRKCVESFDRIAEQYNETQLRVIVNFFPNEVKKILEENSVTYHNLMIGGTVLSNGTYSAYNRQDSKTPNSIDVLTKDLEKTNLSKPVIIPSTININNGANQSIKSNSLSNQNIPNKQIPQYGGMPQTVMQVRPKSNMTNNIQPQNGQMVKNNNMQMPSNANVLNNTKTASNMNVPNNIQMQNNTQVPNYSQMQNNNNQVSNNAQMQNNAQVPNNTQVQNNAKLINDYKQGVEEKMQSPMNNNNEVGKVVPEITQKRGRGRPRKIVQPVTAPINSLTNIDNTPTALTELPPVQPIPSIQPMENTQKRKRGRPSKKSLENIQNQPNTVVSENNNNEQIITASNNQMNDRKPLNMPQNDILSGLEETNETVDLFSMDPIDDSIMDLEKIDSNQSSTTPKLENDIENLNNNNSENSDYSGIETLSDNSNLFDLDIEETNTNNNENLINNIDNDINSNPYSNLNNVNLSNNLNNDILSQTYENANESLNISPYGNANDLTYGSLSNPSYRNFNGTQYNNANYGNMNNPAYRNMNNPQYGNVNNNSINQNNMQSNYNNLINTQVTTNTNNNSYARNGKIVSFIGTSKNGISFIVNNLAQLLSQNGVKTAILDLTKNKNSYYMFTDNDPNLMKKATESMKNLSNGVIDGLNINKNLTIFTSLPDEIETLNDEVMLQTLSNNYEIVLLDCDYATDAVYFIKSNEIYLVQSMDTFTIQPLTQFLSNLKIQNALDESKLRIVINKYVKLKKLDEKMIIGGMSKYNEPSMTLQRDLFNAQTIKYVCIPFEMDTYARYLESIAMCSLSLNGYSQNFINSLEELSKMVFPLIAGGNNNSQNNTEEKHGLFGGKKNKTQQSTQFSNNVNDTLNKMRTNNF